MNKICLSLGMVSGGDYEEVRHGQGGRPHMRQKSWRYSR